MKAPLWAALVLFLAAGAASGANHVIVTVGNSFSPVNLTIEAGDTVTWRNSGLGFHNVDADDGSFTCANGCDGEGGNGSPASNLWQFTRRFDTPGNVGYHCDVHLGVGMAGNITVTPSVPDMPGQLRFAQASAQVNEDDGSATFTVNRVNGDDGAVSVSFATSNGSAQAGSDYTAANGTLSWGDGDDDPRTISVPILDDDVDENNETVNLTLSNPTGGATLGSPSTATLTIRDDDDPTPQPGRLEFASPLFNAGEGSGSATITVTRSGGSQGAVDVSYAASDGSAIDGSDYLAVSGVLSWGNGDSSARSFDVAIVDDAEEESAETVNLTLSNPTGGASLGNPSSASLTIADNDSPAAMCAADEDTLCLNQGGRFRAEVTWRDFQEQTGPGKTADFANQDSGLFYFFSPNNIEMLVKVLDGCNIPGFGTYWVFFAATTDVEFTLTVTDTQSGESKIYTNPLGQPANAITDTQAFATCP